MTGICAFSATSASRFSIFVALYCSSVIPLLSISGEYRCLVLAGLCQIYDDDYHSGPICPCFNP